MRPCAAAALCAPLTRLRLAAALLYTPLGLLFSRGGRGDVLLSAAPTARGRTRGAAGLGEEAQPLTVTEDEEERLIHASHRTFGRQLRRFLEHYVGSEARARSAGLRSRRRR